MAEPVFVGPPGLPVDLRQLVLPRGAEATLLDLVRALDALTPPGQELAYALGIVVPVPSDVPISHDRLIRNPKTRTFAAPQSFEIAANDLEAARLCLANISHLPLRLLADPIQNSVCIRYFLVGVCYTGVILLCAALSI